MSRGRVHEDGTYRTSEVESGVRTRSRRERRHKDRRKKSNLASRRIFVRIHLWEYVSRKEKIPYSGGESWVGVGSIMEEQKHWRLCTGNKTQSHTEEFPCSTGWTDDIGECVKLRKRHSPSPVPHASISYRNKYQPNMPKTISDYRNQGFWRKKQGRGGLNRYSSFKFLEPAPVWAS